MTVDFRAVVSTDIGTCISGDIGSNHISDGSGLVMTAGRLKMNGIVTPARGTPVNIVIVRPQYNTITRFPKPLFVIRAIANPIDRTSEIEVGCRLTLMKNKKEKIFYASDLYTPPEFTNVVSIRKQRKKELDAAIEGLFKLYSTTVQSAKSTNQASSNGATGYFHAGPSASVVSGQWGDIAQKSLAYEKVNVTVPILAQKVLEFCLANIGIELSPLSRPLLFRFSRPSIDLSNGYVEIIGDLIKSESCFGRILPDGKFQVVKIDLARGKTGPVLTADNLESIEPISTGQEPPDNYIMCYTAIESPLITEGGLSIKGYIDSINDLPTNAKNGDAYVQVVSGSGFIIWGRINSTWTTMESPFTIINVPLAAVQVAANLPSSVG